MPIRATVISDASVYEEGRPPNQKVFGGWAAHVRIDGNPKPIRGYGSIHNTTAKLTSTTCEMFAAINGIWLAKEKGATEVLVRSDCMAVISAITKGDLSFKMLEIWHVALTHAKCLDVSLRAHHVRAHTEAADATSWINDWCDRHARRGMSFSRKGIKCLELR